MESENSVSIIFTKYDEKGNIANMITVGEVPTITKAEDKMMSMFVNFCRDVSKKPLEREHYANGFAWMHHGLKYQLHYIIKEVNN